MKHASKFSIISVLLLVLGLASCNNSGDGEDENFVSSYARTTISGVIFDENHNPKSNVEVKAYGQSFTTGSDGVFLFTNLFVPKNKCYVVVEADGYFSCMRSRKPNLNAITRMDVHLVSLQEGEFFSFSSGTNYTANLSDGSSITFASSTAFVDKNGAPYTGTVNIHAKVLDASSPLYSRYAFGGDQIGLDNNEEQFLDTYTGMLVEISQPDGSYVQLAEGTTPAEVVQIIPPVFLTKSAPNSIPVYHASLTSGYNKRRGGGTKHGGGYVLSVGHFSYWSTQEQSPQYGTLKCRVIDAGGNTISGARVQVGKTYGITDDYGTFEIAVPAGLPMDIAILPEDFYGISVVSPQSAWSDREERFVELKTPTVLNRVQGQLVDCDDNPIAGQVSLVWSSNVSSIYTLSGSFDLPINAYPGETYQLNVNTETIDTTLVLTMGNESENLGNIKLCEEYIPEPIVSKSSIRIQDNHENIIEEYNNFSTETGRLYIDAINSYEWTEIHISGHGADLSFSIGDCSGIGSYSADVLGTFNSVEIMDLYVNITEYGSVGGKIKGTAQGVIFNTSNTIRVNFEVDRVEH